jgi:hypothetical protein
VRRQEQSQAEAAVVPGLAADPDDPDVPARAPGDLVEGQLEVRELPAVELLGVDREVARTGAAADVLAEKRADRLAVAVALLALLDQINAPP